MESTKFNLGYMIFLSFVAAIGGLLFGYDTAVILELSVRLPINSNSMHYNKVGM